MRSLEIMYQQWMQGNDAYVHRWIDFVELASRECEITSDQVLKELQKCTWFKQGG